MDIFNYLSVKRLLITLFPKKLETQYTSKSKGLDK